MAVNISKDDIEAISRMVASEVGGNVSGDKSVHIKAVTDTILNRVAVGFNAPSVQQGIDKKWAFSGITAAKGWRNWSPTRNGKISEETMQKVRDQVKARVGEVFATQKTMPTLDFGNPEFTARYPRASKGTKAAMAALAADPASMSVGSPKSGRRHVYGVRPDTPYQTPGSVDISMARGSLYPGMAADSVDRYKAADASPMGTTGFFGNPTIAGMLGAPQPSPRSLPNGMADAPNAGGSLVGDIASTIGNAALGGFRTVLGGSPAPDTPPANVGAPSSALQRMRDEVAADPRAAAYARQIAARGAQQPGPGPSFQQTGRNGYPETGMTAAPVGAVSRSPLAPISTGSPSPGLAKFRAEIASSPGAQAYATRVVQSVQPTRQPTWNDVKAASTPNGYGAYTASAFQSPQSAFSGVSARPSPNSAPSPATQKFRDTIAADPRAAAYARQTAAPQMAATQEKTPFTKANGYGFGADPSKTAQPAGITGVKAYTDRAAPVEALGYAQRGAPALGKTALSSSGSEVAARTPLSVTRPALGQTAMSSSPSEIAARTPVSVAKPAPAPAQKSALASMPGTLFNGISTAYNAVKTPSLPTFSMPTVKQAQVQQLDATNPNAIKAPPGDLTKFRGSTYLGAPVVDEQGMISSVGKKPVTPGERFQAAITRGLTGLLTGGVAGGVLGAGYGAYTGNGGTLGSLLDGASALGQSSFNKIASSGNLPSNFGFDGGSTFTGSGGGKYDTNSQLGFTMADAEAKMARNYGISTGLGGYGGTGPTKGTGNLY